MVAHTPRANNLALVLLAMTQFVIVIDASIVNVALPSIGAHLHFSRDDLTCVVNAYTLTFGGFLLLGGRIADLLGRRRMFMLGLVVFSLASLAGGLAQSETWLIAARAIQGLGAAIVSPAALSIITTTFADGPERNRAARGRRLPIAPGGRPWITHNNEPTGNRTRSCRQRSSCSHAHLSIPTSRRLSPLPWRTSADPRRASRSVSASASASPIRNPARHSKTISARSRTPSGARARGTHHRDDLLDGRRVGWVAAALVARRAAGRDSPAG